ncbi:MAG: hypothetical protein J0L55_09810 [Caulobacterales bacterium]|nr:hypothetical protein [Caulobacterales bacterium]MCA0372409.1 hypothetical protein [Pseudomonadota bacterium]
MYGQFKISTGLARKFPMPESLKERAIALILIGIAFFSAAMFDPFRDFISSVNGKTAEATFLKSEQYLGTGPKRNIGIYLYEDDQTSKFIIKGKKIYSNPDLIPHNAKVAWPLGSPQKARILGEYNLLPHLITGALGILIVIFGFYLRIISKKEEN